MPTGHSRQHANPTPGRHPDRLLWPDGVNARFAHPARTDREIAASPSWCRMNRQTRLRRPPDFVLLQIVHRQRPFRDPQATRSLRSSPRNRVIRIAWIKGSTQCIESEHLILNVHDVPLAVQHPPKQLRRKRRELKRHNQRRGLKPFVDDANKALVPMANVLVLTPQIERSDGRLNEIADADKTHLLLVSHFPASRLIVRKSNFKHISGPMPNDVQQMSRGPRHIPPTSPRTILARVPALRGHDQCPPSNKKKRATRFA